MFLLENPYEPEYLGWKQFRHDDNDPNSLCYDIVYDMEEDLNTGTLWVGTRGGLSVLYDEENGLFRNYCPDVARIVGRRGEYGYYPQTGV